MREKKLTPRCFATGHVSPRSEPHLSVVRELVKFLAPESTSAVIPFERSRWRGRRFACYAHHVMPQGGAFNCDFRFSLISVSHAKSIDCRRKKIQFP